MKATIEPKPAAAEEHAPRKLTFAENLILTIKVLVGFAVLGAAIWGLKLWTSPPAGQ